VSEQYQGDKSINLVFIAEEYLNNIVELGKKSSDLK